MEQLITSIQLVFLTASDHHRKTLTAKINSSRRTDRSFPLPPSLWFSNLINRWMDLDVSEWKIAAVNGIPEEILY